MENTVQPTHISAPELDLKYRRQFIATFQQLNGFSHWQHFGQWVHWPHFDFQEECLHIYAHPDLEMASACNIDKNIALTLLGFAIDPEHPDRTNKEIVNELAHASIESVEAFAIAISNLAGRFVIILSLSNQIYVFHDACGLRSVYYANMNGKIYIASQPLLFSEFFDLKPTDRYRIYNQSSYKLSNIQSWLPCGLTLYENIYQLIPNHYLDVLKAEQKRYWPDRQICKQEIEVASERSADMLKELLFSANQRYRLALSVTAGVDSRVLLAASKNIVNEMFVFTIMFEWMTERSRDIEIPKSITKQNQIKYHVLDCSSKIIDPEFQKLYKANVDLAKDYKASVCFSLLSRFPQDRVWVKGSCSEIACCAFYEYGIHDEIVSPRQLVALRPGWDTIPFIAEYLDEWLGSAIRVCSDSNMDILDLFYWEHFMGSWQAQSWLEWDILQESFSPYNYRPLLTTMLGVSVKYRRAPDYLLYRRITNRLWPELLKWPINPTTGIKRLELHLRKLLLDMGIYNEVRKQHRAIKSLIHHGPG